MTAKLQNNFSHSFLNTKITVAGAVATGVGVVSISAGLLSTPAALIATASIISAAGIAYSAVRCFRKPPSHKIKTDPKVGNEKSIVASIFRAKVESPLPAPTQQHEASVSISLAQTSQLAQQVTRKFEYSTPRGMLTIVAFKDATQPYPGVDQWRLSTKNSYMRLTIHPNGKKYLSSYDMQLNEKKRGYIEMIKTNDEHGQGHATALVQAANELCRENGCEGRMELSSSWSAHTFWYQLGFRSTDQKINEKIENWLGRYKESRQVVKREMDKSPSINMYLPQESIDQWSQRIKELSAFHS